jgi:hypothetical protein
MAVWYPSGAALLPVILLYTSSASTVLGPVSIRNGDHGCAEKPAGGQQGEEFRSLLLLLAAFSCVCKLAKRSQHVDNHVLVLRSCS